MTYVGPMHSKKNTMDDRQKMCQRIADMIVDMIHMAGRKRDDESFAIRYERMTDESLARIKEWDRKWLGLLSGEEYFLVTCDKCLTYAVNITADAYLTAAEELIKLVAVKF